MLSLRSADQPPHLLGGYGEYLLPGSLIYKGGNRVPDLAASLSLVIGNGVRWVKTLAQMTFEESLLISEVGSQGLATLMAARECRRRAAFEEKANPPEGFIKGAVAFA